MAATGPPRKLSRTAANKAVKENRPVVGETELMKGSKTITPSVLQRSKSGGAKQARQAKVAMTAVDPSRAIVPTTRGCYHRRRSRSGGHPVLYNSMV